MKGINFDTLYERWNQSKGQKMYCTLFMCLSVAICMCSVLFYSRLSQKKAKIETLEEDYRLSQQKLKESTEMCDTLRNEILSERVCAAVSC